jgi:hypothetical protein
MGEVFLIGKQDGLPATHVVSDSNVVGNDSMVCVWMFDIKLQLDVPVVHVEFITPVGKGKGDCFGCPAPVMYWDGLAGTGAAEGRNGAEHGK